MGVSGGEHVDPRDLEATRRRQGVLGGVGFGDRLRQFLAEGVGDGDKDTAEGGGLRSRSSG